MGGNSTRLRVGVAFASILLLCACEQQNKYQPPPPAEVTVAKPDQRKVTLYMELTGSTAPLNRVDLVARVQGFLDKVGYKDGAAVKKGDLLFQIDPEDYKIALQIAQATSAAAGSAADSGRRRPQAQARSRQDLRGVDRASRRIRAKRDSTIAALDQAKGQVEQAKRNLAYTTITRPSTASCPRASSIRAPWSAPAARPSSPPSCSSIRST